MVVGIRQTRSATSTATEGTCPKPVAVTLYAAKGCSVITANKKMSVRPAIRIFKAISFGVFCRSAPDFDVVGKNFRAAGDSAAVAAGFPDHGCAFSRNDRFVHSGDAVDDFAITRNNVSRFANDDVAGTQLRCGDLFDLVPAGEPLGNGIRLGLAQRFRLRFAARFGHGFGEVGEKNCKPEPQRDLNLEPDSRAAGEEIAD
jgi:hypothetical protein